MTLRSQHLPWHGFQGAFLFFVVVISFKLICSLDKYLLKPGLGPAANNPWWTQIASRRPKFQRRQGTGEEGRAEAKVGVLGLVFASWKTGIFLGLPIHEIHGGPRTWQLACEHWGIKGVSTWFFFFYGNPRLWIEIVSISLLMSSLLVVITERASYSDPKLSSKMLIIDSSGSCSSAPHLRMQGSISARCEHGLVYRQFPSLLPLSLPFCGEMSLLFHLGVKKTDSEISRHSQTQWGSWEVRIWTSALCTVCSVGYQASPPQSHSPLCS